MADEATPAIGMSVGATTLAAVTTDGAVTRRPVLTLYRNQPSHVGAPAENEDSDEPGLVFTDFVNRVGDSAPVVATDGSNHRAEELLVDGLYALAKAATGGRPLPSVVAVSHPAHWSTAGVAALHAALSRMPEWSQDSVSLVSDVDAAVTALRASPGLPDSGIIAVCDFGGSGTSITLVDAAGGYRQVGHTVRHTDFSGEGIDQALLNHVVDELSTSGSLDGALAISSLSGLRGNCREAKEQLSTQTVTELTVDLPGYRGGSWVTRAELDEVIRRPLDAVLTAVQEALDRRRIPAAGLAAVVSVGGGANIPAISTALSQRFGVSVVSSPRPQLAAAIGAALGIAGDPADTAAPAPARAAAPPPPVAPPPAETAPPPAGFPPPPPGFEAPPAGFEAPRPQPAVEQRSFAGYELVPDRTGDDRGTWYRKPLPVILATALAVLILGAVAVIALRQASRGEPAPSTVTPTSTSSTYRLPPAPTRPPVLPELPGPPQLPENPEPPTFPELPETFEPPISPPAPGPEITDTPTAP